MKFTVLGGSGFVGTHLVKHLLAAGHEVMVPPRNASPDSSVPLGHAIYAIGLTGDFRNRPYDTIDAHVNILGRWLKESSFDSLLYLSSTRVYGTMPTDTHEDASIAAKADADSLYNLSKLLGESLCVSQQRKDVRIARLSNIYGDGQNEQTFLGSLINSAATSKNILVEEDPESAKDYISVFDAVSCIEKIALSGTHQTYNVASGENTSHRDITDLLSRNSPVRIAFESQAGLRKFPLINTSRLQSEFPFTPRRLLQDLPGLVNRTLNN